MSALTLIAESGQALSCAACGFPLTDGLVGQTADGKFKHWRCPQPAQATKYKTIMADPPWPERGGGKIKRGADRHYPLMEVSAICALGPQVQRLADPVGCHLYLWVTNNYLRAGFEVLDAWGFEYITLITWEKDRAGLGQYFRGITEHIMFARRGKPLPYKSLDGKRAQGMTILKRPRKEHSAKPDSFYRMAERVSYEPRLEMFARTKRPGWDAWGNEVPNDVEIVDASTPQMALL